MDSQKSTPLIKSEDELSRCIELLKLKRQEIHEKILEEQEDRDRIQKEMALLAERLQAVTDSIDRKSQARAEYDKTIRETSAAYTKIRESAKSLLHVLKREENHLGNKLYPGASGEVKRSLKETENMHY